MFSRINSVKAQRLGRAATLLNAGPVTTSCARDLSSEVFKTGTIYRDFEQLKLLKKKGDANFDAYLQAFHETFVPSTVSTTYPAVVKHVKQLEKDNDENVTSVADAFINDVRELARDFKGKDNHYSNFIKMNKVAINNQMKDGERFLVAASRAFKRTSNVEQDRLARAANNLYSAKYRSMSAKYAKDNLAIPQFLNPYKPAESNVAIADRTLWQRVNKELKSADASEKATAVMVKAQKVEKKAAHIAARAEYGFHENYTFTGSVHLLTMKHLREKNPGVHLVELLKNSKMYKSKMTAMDRKRIEDKSNALRAEFEAKNKTASAKAIQDKAWNALKSSEVEAHGSKEDLKAFRQFGYAGKKANAMAQETNADKPVKKNMKMEQKKCREVHGFNSDLTFRCNPYMLYMAKNNLSPKTAKGWESKVTLAEKNSLTAQANKLKKEYEKQNMKAAKSAIAAGDWIALKVGEVKEFGTKEDLKKYTKAKKEFEAGLMQQVTSGK